MQQPSNPNKQSDPNKKNSWIVMVVLIVLIIGAGIFIYQRFARGLIAAWAPSRQNIAKQLDSHEQNQQQTNDGDEIGEPTQDESTGIPLTLPDTFRISVFAKELGSVRDLQLDPAGTMLASVPKKGQILALPDANADGKADESIVVVDGLSNPHGIAFYNNVLYIAEETRISRFDYDRQTHKASNKKILFDIPKGGTHTSRSIVFNKKGDLFVTIGSTCNVCEEKNSFHAAVIVSDADGKTPRTWATGLRNSVFLKINPDTDEVWGTEMGRDNLGDNIPPEEINIIRDGKHYGWPYCYSNKIWDHSFGQKDAHFCDQTEAPLFEMQAHSAPLGLTFINSPQFPADWQGDLLVAFHGSWNRSEPTGYKIVRIDREGDKLIEQQDFIFGWLESRVSLGRPVDLEFDSAGALFISDDKANLIYKVQAKNSQ